MFGHPLLRNCDYRGGHCLRRKLGRLYVLGRFLHGYGERSWIYQCWNVTSWIAAEYPPLDSVVKMTRNAALACITSGPAAYSSLIARKEALPEPFSMVAWGGNLFDHDRLFSGRQICAQRDLCFSRALRYADIVMRSPGRLNKRLVADPSSVDCTSISAQSTACVCGNGMSSPIFAFRPRADLGEAEPERPAKTVE